MEFTGGAMGRTEEAQGLDLGEHQHGDGIFEKTKQGVRHLPRDLMKSQ